MATTPEPAKEPMATLVLSNMCHKLGLSDKVTATSSVDDLQSLILSKIPTTLETKPEPSEAELKLSRENRELKIDSLNSKLTPASVKILKDSFCGDGSLILSEGSGSAVVFDTVLKIVNELPELKIPTTEKTNGQTISLAKEDEQEPEEKQIVSDAKRRAEEAVSLAQRNN